MKKIFVLAFVISSCSNSLIQHSAALPDYDLSHYKEEKYAPGQWQELVQLSRDSTKRIRISSMNIMMDIFDAKLKPEERWAERLPFVIETVKLMQPDVFAVQEAQSSQTAGLKKELESDFDFISSNATIRKLDAKEELDDGIFYRKSRLILEESKILFTSHTPNVPSKFEDFKFPKTIQFAIFKDRLTKNRFGMIAQHMDFFSASIREQTVGVICDIVKHQAKGLPVFTVGDYNLFPNRRELNLPFYDGDYIDLLLEQTCQLKDARRFAAFGHLGPIASFTNTPENPRTPFTGFGVPGIFLDRIYFRDARILSHGTFAQVFSGSKYASDHFAIYADVLL